MRNRVLRWVLFVLAALQPHLARAQWTLVTPLPAGTSTVYFLDRVGTPKVGFVGMTTGMIRTSDGGTTWSGLMATGFNIRDFSFWDAQHGIAVAAAGNAVFSTSDAGQTWTQTVYFGTSATSAVFFSGSNLVLLNSLSSGGTGLAMMSKDFGQTWTQNNTLGSDMAGYAAADGLRGIAAPHRGQSTASLHYTTDGGVSWQQTSFFEHIYSPTALDWLPGTYVGLSEVSDSFWVSNDYGKSWSFVAKCPAFPTGTLRAHNGYIWAQTATGVLLTTDIGKTWTSLCGPSAGRDCRFYNIDSTLYAADIRTATLWRCDDGRFGPGTTKLAFDPIQRFSTQLCSEVDTVIHIGASNCFDLLDTAFLTGSPNLRITYPNFPTELKPTNSIILHYAPDSVHQVDTVILHIRWGFPGRTHDTTLKVIARVIGGTNSVTLAALAASLPEPCAALDTQLTIRSINCQPIVLRRVYLEDSSVFRVGQIPLPDTLASRAPLKITIHASPVTIGDVATRIHIVASTPQGDIDTSFPLTLTVGSNFAKPLLSELRAISRDLCDWIDTVIWLKNPGCKDLVLHHISGLDSNVTLYDALFPITIRGGDSIPIHLRLLPQAKPYALALGFGFHYGDLPFDTTFLVTSQTISKTRPIPRLTTSPLRFGLTSSCVEKRLPLLMLNEKCSDVQLIDIKWSIADTQFFFEPFTLPRVIGTGNIDSVFFHYKPSLLKPSTAAVTLTFLLSGEKHDTTIYITGIGTDTESAVLSNESLHYGTISKCESRLDTTIFNNVSCDTMVIASIYDWQQNGYTVLSPTLPIVVPPGNSVSIVVQLRRSTDGVVGDSLDIQYASTKPPHTLLRLRLKLTGSIHTQLSPPKLSGIDFSRVQLPPCAELDTFFVLSNPNVCDTVNLDRANAVAYITLLTPLPLRLPPGASDTIRFHYRPPQDTGTSSIQLLGTSLDTSIVIYTLRPSSTAPIWSPASFATFVARTCSTASDTLTITAQGCDSVTIDRITILPAGSNYQLESSYSVPHNLNGTMRITVKYDPSIGGSDTASLYVHSVDGKLDLRMPLMGRTTTVQAVQLGIRNDSSTSVTNVDAGKGTSVSLITLDAIDDSLALSTIDVAFAMNQNILTLESVQPGPHLSTVSSSQQLNSLALGLQRSDHASLPAGSVLATLTFSTYVSDTIVSDVSLQRVRFNASDDSYEDCVLHAETDPHALTVKLDPSCNRDFLSGAMAGQGILTAIRVRPSVLSGDERLTLDLEAKRATAVEVQLFNMLGQQIANTTFGVLRGSSSALLPFENIPAGLVFVRCNAEGASATQRIVVQR